MNDEFGIWMAAVNRELLRSAGIRVIDLADYNFRDAFGDEIEPAEVAREMLEREGWR